ncbi:MAG: hypothetical protein RR639_03390 [Hydrogenoanaerobacterium sp.]
MPDYQKLYTLLFNNITDIIGELQTIQQQAEDYYINEENEIKKTNEIT